ncbi:Tyrosine-protein kinase RYK [Portunus trituberculatus]|uniref:Tyrosine-protein kinase RYK n=1 Tax=Portunus trituberculatus TaxID=210409 RepID=A0A5B7GMY2_PORTR|nr:Tyrosine-protein kinase RYK [Portunus trituberculatus]
MQSSGGGLAGVCCRSGGRVPALRLITTLAGVLTALLSRPLTPRLPTLARLMLRLFPALSGEASSAQARMAVREGLLLAGLHHQHLLPVLGVCLADPRRPLLLYPHLGLTNLKTYLLGCGRGSNEGVKLLTRDLVHIAIQICLGLIHLHQQRLLHKDVATRNCL